MLYSGMAHMEAILLDMSAIKRISICIVKFNVNLTMTFL